MRAKLQVGEGTLEPYNSEIRRAHRRRKMDANYARIEMEANFHKVFCIMADKVHYYISIQNPTVTSDSAWIFSFKPTKNQKVKFF